MRQVLRKVIVLCLLYLLLIIGVMKATTVFMSWLVAQVSGMPLHTATGRPCRPNPDEPR